MNAIAQFKPLNFAPLVRTFPSLTVCREDYPMVEDNQVTFSLVDGDAYINVTVEAETVSDEMGVEFSSDPQEGFYMDYDVLEVKADALGVVSDIWEINAFEGMTIRITEAQREELNTILAEMAKYQFEKDLAA